MNNKILQSKDKLFVEINKVLEDRKTDMKLQKKLNDRFLEKGLGNNTVNAIFTNNMAIEQLEKDSIRLICLTEGLYNELKETNKYDLDISKYFSDNEILAYKTYVPKREELITSLDLKNVIKINKYEYMTYMTWEYLSKLRKSGLPKYNKNIQRPAKIEVLSNGEYVYRMNVNKDGINDLKNRYEGKDKDGNIVEDENKKILTTAISFCVLMEEGKEPIFNWNGNNEPNSVGDLFIKPIFDIDSENFAPLIIDDGYHRFLAGCDAYDECESNGEKLEGGLAVFIYLVAPERAKVHVDDTFKRTDISKEEKESISKTPVTDALDTLIDKTSVLKNHTAPTFEYYSAFKGNITYRTLLIKTLEETGINFNKVFITDRKMSKMANIINNIFNYYEENNIDKDSLLYSSGIFVGYIAIANELLRENDKIDLDVIARISEELIQLKDSLELRDMNLNKRNLKVKEIYKFFEKLASNALKMEVIY